MRPVRLFAVLLTGAVAASGGLAYSHILGADVAGAVERRISPTEERPFSLPESGEPAASDRDEAAEAAQVQVATAKPWDSLTASEVRRIQELLRAARVFDRAPTGTYGPVTEEAVRRFQSSHGLPVTGFAGPLTMAKLRGLSASPASVDPRCQLPGKVLCIDKAGRVLRAVEDGEVIATADARFGREGMETREGVHKIYRKSRDHVSNIYDTSMPFAMFFSGGQAVHYSPDFAANGYSGASHGCINLRSRATAERLFDWAEVGTSVVVYSGG